MSIVINTYPRCGKCKEEADMVPVEDSAPNGNVVYLKGWVCPNCGNNVILDKGRLTKQEIIKEQTR